MNVIIADKHGLETIDLSIVYEIGQINGKYDDKRHLWDCLSFSICLKTPDSYLWKNFYFYDLASAVESLQKLEKAFGEFKKDHKK